MLADSPHSGSVLGDRLEQIGLRGYFVAVLTSRDFSQRPSLAAANEPASDDFAAALDALVLPAGDVAFVSHHSGKRGSAVRAGIRAIALGGKAMSGADIQILRFEELLRHARVASSRGIAC